MSLSNPTTENQNPASRWFQWNGEKGNIRYYDKKEEKNIEVSLPFTFIVLDQLSTIKGWHEPSESGIYANEVRDTRSERLLVKSFKGGEIAEGFYNEIKDKVSASGGHYVQNIYIAFYSGDVLFIGSLQLKGAALGAWMTFYKQSKKAIAEKAVCIESFDRGKKGSVSFTTPVFSLKEIKPETLQYATGLDVEVQNYLKTYLSSHTAAKVQIVLQDDINAGFAESVAQEDDLPF